MSTRRSNFEIMLDILTVIIEGETKPTRIMYRANLSWGSLNDTLENLVENGLIEEQKIPRNKREKRRYNITEKGRNVAKYYKNMAELINTGKPTPQLDY